MALASIVSGSVLGFFTAVMSLIFTDVSYLGAFGIYLGLSFSIVFFGMFLSVIAETSKAEEVASSQGQLANG